MNVSELKALHNACHDFGSVKLGEFPNWDAVQTARKEKRLQAVDNNTHGYIRIIGDNECFVEFDL